MNVFFETMKKSPHKIIIMIRWRHTVAELIKGYLEYLCSPPMSLSLAERPKTSHAGDFIHHTLNLDL